MSTPKWVVTEAFPHDDYTIELSFADGSQRIFDARGLLSEPFFALLNSLPFFMKAHADCGTVVWNDEIDIAPEHLYENSTVIA